MSAFSRGWLEGLWKARNRETDTPLQRASIRYHLREAVRRERARRYGLPGTYGISAESRRLHGLKRVA